MNHIGTQRIETERLRLRPFAMEDVEPMFRNWASDSKVTRFLTWPAHENMEVSGRVIQSWMERADDPGWYQWAIELKNLDEPVGSIAAVKLDEETETVTIGYCIGRSWWGMGITAEALRAVIAFFFNQVGANRVNAYHDPRNPNSGKVMMKCGMTYEGTLRAAGINNQGLCDESWYSILRSEYMMGTKQGICIRTEEPGDYHVVEALIKRAFWNVNVPGCDEHYLAHRLRQHEDFIPELDLVAVSDTGSIVGNVMYTKAVLRDEAGEMLSVLTFGPISVDPAHQRQGIGRKLLEHSFQKAVKLGYTVIVIYGNPDNYVTSGFKSCRKYDVHAEDGSYPAAMLVKELQEGVLEGRSWVYCESPAYEIDSSAAESFDKDFEPLPKEFRPSQEEFYIHSHSVIRA